MNSIFRWACALVMVGCVAALVACPDSNTTPDGGSDHRVGSFVPTFRGGYFGDGSDGNVTLDCSTTYASFSTFSDASCTYTQTRDLYASNLTVNAGVTLFSANFHVYVYGTLSNSGTISVQGNAGSGFTGGAAIAQGSNSFLTGAGGTGGVNADGSAGTVATSGVSAIGGAGGAGGIAITNTGGTGADAAALGNINGGPVPRTLWAAVAGSPNGLASAMRAGSGGGGGGSDVATAEAGGGGGGGGGLSVFASVFSNFGTGIVTANGGAGAAATGVGNAGGGGGGGGGYVYVVTMTGLVNGDAGTVDGSTPAVTANGGLGGAGVGDGSAGVNGKPGSVVFLPVQ